jgi:ferredoxin
MKLDTPLTTRAPPTSAAVSDSTKDEMKAEIKRLQNELDQEMKQFESDHPNDKADKNKEPFKTKVCLKCL